ncbi:MAG: PDZ domain-containing protein [Planctomycetota bacterium]|nr:PDZ domain-containing protein [Planctomycetota bacterium]
MRVLLCLGLVCFCLDPVRADELDDALGRLRKSPRGESAATVAAVMKLAPDPTDLVRRLEAGVAVEPIKAGWHRLDATDEKGVTRPLQIYVPEIARSGDTPGLLVYMHGGVARPDYALDVRGYARMWTGAADEHGIVLAFPRARADSKWWRPEGVAHVLASIREVKRHITVNDNRIFATGFSDGGSGCFHLALAAPGPFAGTLPFNGHPAVAASDSGEQLYLHNLTHLPMLVAATRDDQLYPAAAVLEHLLPALKRGARMRIISYESGGHQPVYFEDQADAFGRFVDGTQRVAMPKRLDWRCASPATGRVAWLEVLELGETKEAVPAGEDINFQSTPGRVRLGVNIDTAFAGPGVKITTVADESNASRLGMAVGDVLIGMDGEQVSDVDSLRTALAKKRHGDGLRVLLRRGQDELAKETKIPAFQPRPYYTRTKPTAHVAAVVDGTRIRLRVRGARHLRLYLSPHLVPDGPVRIELNGQELDANPVPLSAKAILERYARDADGARVYTRYVDIFLAK